MYAAEVQFKNMTESHISTKEMWDSVIFNFSALKSGYYLCNIVKNIDRNYID